MSFITGFGGGLNQVFQNKLTLVLVLIAVMIMFLLPIVKSNPYLSIALWSLGLGTIIMAFIQSVINQIKSNRIQ
jgi:RsiW-degrading membrane proteinase PrsW (M82 family)